MALDKKILVELCINKYKKWRNVKGILTPNHERKFFEDFYETAGKSLNAHEINIIKFYKPLGIVK